MSIVALCNSGKGRYTQIVTSRDVIEQTALGGELAAIRVEARLSQEGLAKLARISRNAVGEIERGITQPKLETLRALANAAATDGAGQLDHGKAQSYYERLTRAGKAAPEEPPSSPASVEELTDEDVKEIGRAHV